MKYVKISSKDNVAVTLCDMNAGEVCGNVTLKNDIPCGHKFALCDIKCGENIIKYAAPIGHASCDVKAGEHIHTHNVKSNLAGLLEYEYNPELPESGSMTAKTFMGYRRADGKDRCLQHNRRNRCNRKRKLYVRYRRAKHHGRYDSGIHLRSRR